MKIIIEKTKIIDWVLMLLLIIVIFFGTYFIARALILIVEVLHNMTKILQTGNEIDFSKLKLAIESLNNN